MTDSLPYVMGDATQIPPIYPDYAARAKEEMKRIRKERFHRLLIEHLERFAPDKLTMSVCPECRDGLVPNTPGCYGKICVNYGCDYEEADPQSCRQPMDTLP